MAEVEMHIDERSAYSSALCSTCRWKLSACDDCDTPSVIRRSPDEIRQRAHEHAITSGHKVSMIETIHTTYDYTIP